MTAIRYAVSLSGSTLVYSSESSTDDDKILDIDPFGSAADNDGELHLPVICPKKFSTSFYYLNLLFQE